VCCVIEDWLDILPTVRLRDPDARCGAGWRQFRHGWPPVGRSTSGLLCNAFSQCRIAGQTFIRGCAPAAFTFILGVVSPGVGPPIVERIGAAEPKIWSPKTSS